VGDGGRDEFPGIRQASPGGRGPGAHQEGLCGRGGGLSFGAGVRRRGRGNSGSSLAAGAIARKGRQTRGCIQAIPNFVEHVLGCQGRTGSRLPLLRRGSPAGGRARSGFRSKLPPPGNKRRRAAHAARTLYDSTAGGRRPEDLPTNCRDGTSRGAGQRFCTRARADRIGWRIGLGSLRRRALAGYPHLSAAAVAGIGAGRIVHQGCSSRRAASHARDRR
jgi:hypothetical protein